LVWTIELAGGRRPLDHFVAVVYAVMFELGFDLESLEDKLTEKNLA